MSAYFCYITEAELLFCFLQFIFHANQDYYYDVFCNAWMTAALKLSNSVHKVNVTY